MKVTLFPRENDTYLLQVDNVITTISDRALIYILEGKSYSEDEGWTRIKDRDAIALPNEVRIFVPDKNDFIAELKKARQYVDAHNDTYSFGVE